MSLILSLNLFLCNSGFYFLLSLSQAVLVALARTHLFILFPSALIFLYLQRCRGLFYWSCHLSDSKVQQHLLFTYIKAIMRKRNYSL